MTKLTRLLALFSFAALTFSTIGCGRSDLIDYAQVGDGGAPPDARVDAATDAKKDGDARPPTRCTSNGDCASTPATPFCELPAGVCVACLTNPNTCPTGELCSPTTHECIPGTSCQSTGCPTPDTCCGDFCVDTTTSSSSCGFCGNVCPTGSVCADSFCQTPGTCNGGPTCTGADSCCPSGCTDVNTDPNNCSTCGFGCPTGDTCVAGNCTAPASCNGGPICTGVQQCCATGCTDIDTDPNNCSGCDNVCPAGDTCVAGVCTAPARCNHGPSCSGTLQCCPAGCVDIDNDPSNCGQCGNSCAPGATCVGAVCQNPTCTCPGGLSCCNAGPAIFCADLTSDSNNCGFCGNTCGTGSACVGGTCQAATCNGGPTCTGSQQCCGTGCSDLQTDPNNCSQCGFKCSTGDTCVAGICTPPASCHGGPVCTGLEQCCSAGCTNIDTDPKNCSACGKVCPPSFTCQTGACTPPASCNGGPLCTGQTQCCTSGCSDVNTDPNNCGACGNVCATGDTCKGGTCQAPATCNGGPVCTGTELCCTSGCSDTTTDTKNCGACGKACPAGDTCVASVCKVPTTCNGGPACPAADTCCPAGCLSTTSDPNNCGGCGVVCAAGDTCVASTCVSNEGPFNPTVNPTYLSPGPHSFTSINIPAGITVYVAGQGAASGTLNLTSTGAVVINGTIDLSGGPGTQNTITSSNTQAGRAGGGGFTGEPYESAVGSSACSFVAGNGGSLGDAISGSTGSCFVASTTTCIQQTNNNSLLFTAPVATYGGGAGIFTGYRAYGGGGGGPAGGAPGALGAAYPGEADCSGVSGGGGATGGQGGAGTGVYKGSAGVLGKTQCAGLQPGVPAAYVGGGGGGSIGTAAIADLPVATTFQTGSAGGGGSADYLNRPVFGGTSGGGGGGGALKVSSSTSITINGQVLANGGPGGDAVIGIGANAGCDPQPGAAGGGGSGGVIYLAAPTLTVATGATVSAAGGAGGGGSEFATGGAGGAGGMGRVRLSVTAPSCASLQGAFTPALPAGCAAGAATAGKTYIATYPN